MYEVTYHEIKTSRNAFVESVASFKSSSYLLFRVSPRATYLTVNRAM